MYVTYYGVYFNVNFLGWKLRGVNPFSTFSCFHAFEKSLMARRVVPCPEAWRPPLPVRQRAQAAAHASRISEARDKLNLTQKEFATLLGISRRTVENWEQGHREPTGAARILIEVAMSHPKAVLAAVA